MQPVPSPTHPVPLSSAGALGGNPFATRWVRPGALPYLFAQGESVQSLRRRLETNGWRGQIVGDHGTGKSTLLATLLPALSADGQHIREITLNNGMRSLPAGWHHAAEARGALLVVDGYEQLSGWSRWRLKRLCRTRACGLLVTAHATVGLPMLYQTTASLDDVQRIVERLLSRTPGMIRQSDIAQAWSQNAGNIRETLFALYDRFESVRRSNGRAD